MKLIQLLSIYNELSTTELVQKSGKTKPTVLKHLGDLVEFGEVSVREEKKKSPGAYRRRYYSRKRGSYTIRGQDLHDKAREDPKFVLNYNNFKLAQLMILKDIVDSMVIYQKRLNIEVEHNLEDPEKTIQILKDNLGSTIMEYLSRKQLFGKGEETVKEYLKVELIMPIKRIIEQLKVDDWKIDGTLWDYSK